MSNQDIPLSTPWLTEHERALVLECIDSGWISSVSPMVQRFEHALAAYTGAHYVVATQSGTAALHLSLLLVGVQAGDRVLIPNMTFVASANAVAYIGAQPILVDCEPQNWQLDIALLERFLSQETEVREGKCWHTKHNYRIAALMPVHVLGSMGEMERLIQIADHYALPIVEDASEAIGTAALGKHAGTWGTLGCLSFNGNKLLTTAGGGALLTNDAELAKRALHLSTQAKSGGKEYIHDTLGFNYRMSGLHAALGVAQLARIEELLVHRADVATYYREALEDIRDIRWQSVGEDQQANHWLPTLRSSQRDPLLQACWEAKIHARGLWTPMNQLPMYKACRYLSDTDQSGCLYREAVSLPADASLEENSLQSVIKCIRSLY